MGNEELAQGPGDGLSAIVGKWPELERLTRIADVMEQIASHGCGCAQMVSEKWLFCPDMSSDPETWCWCCIAREALQKKE